MIIRAGTSAVSEGGTGATTAAGARTSLATAPAILSGSATLGAGMNLTTSMAATGLSVSLPSAGTYLVAVNIRTQINNTSYVKVQLHNDTANAYVGNVYLTMFDQTGTVTQGTASVTQFLTVAGATTLSLHGVYVDTGGGVPAAIQSDGAGATDISWARIAE